MVDLIMNIKVQSIALYGGGDRDFSTTSLQTIGKATRANEEPCRVRAGHFKDVEEISKTLKELAIMDKKATEGWVETIVSTDALVEQIWVELKKEQTDPDNFVLNFIRASIWGEGYGCNFEKLDNELPGIEEMSEAEVGDLVDSLAKQ